MTTTTLDIYTNWSDALEIAGEQATDQTGDSIPLLTALIGTAYVATTNPQVREALTDEDVLEAQDFLEPYGHLTDAVVSQLLSMGWLDVGQCSDGNPVLVPAYPTVCDCHCDGEPLSQVEEELERQLSDLIQYAESLGGSSEGYGEFCRTVLYPEDGDDE
jgi:hypothetical protein